MSRVSALRKSFLASPIEDWAPPTYEDLFAGCPDKPAIARFISQEMSRVGNMICVFGMRDVHPKEIAVWDSRLTMPPRERYDLFVQEVRRAAASKGNDLLALAEFVDKLDPKGLAEAFGVPDHLHGLEGGLMLGAHLHAKACETSIRVGHETVSHRAVEVTLDGNAYVFDNGFRRFITFRDNLPAIARPNDWYRASVLALTGEK